ncbi:hypothetical protein Riv7116_5895 [Rivularia sp. PCC 7116]|nr:hypothetical protein [Rivularia sp. PCC 7116]AFY58257.1 hypothetical protein Riv7116_5895 [Rivularia sp. PCC 7116]
MYTLLEHDIDYRQIVENVIEGKVADYAAANYKENSSKINLCLFKDR